MLPEQMLDKYNGTVWTGNETSNMALKIQEP
jgi:hypothetical protein